MKNRSREQLRAYNKDMQAKFAANKPAGAAPSISHPNFKTAPTYTGNSMVSHRHGVDDNLLHVSHGMCTQITVRTS